MTWLVLVLLGVFLILQAVRRPARALPPPASPSAPFDPAPRVASGVAPEIADPFAPPPASHVVAAVPHRHHTAPPPPHDWQAQFARTLHGPGLCSPK